MALETFKLIRSLVPKMRILFSVKPDWEKKIRKGFRFTNHELYFEDFTPGNISNKDLVVPLTIPDLRILIQNRELIKNNPIPIPGLEPVNICDDKYLFIQALKKGGFGHLIPKTGTGLPFPFILKKKTSSYGRDCYLISTAEEADKYNDLMGDPDFFCQEVVWGIYEFATHIIFKDNKILSALTIRYEYPGNVSISGKDKYIAKNIAECPYLETFSAILKHIGFEGLCCFDYKVMDDKPFIFEINPRFGGSLSRYFFSFINKTSIGRS